MPNEGEIEQIEEPVIQASIHLPQEFLGGVLGLCEEKRGTQKEIRYLGPKRVMLVYELPLNEIVVDFYDRLKSVSRGYASMDYEVAGYRAADLVKLDVRINGDMVDAMSMIVHRDKAYYRGRDLVQKMRALIPRQMFEVVIQAAIGSRVDFPRSGEGAAQKRHRQMLRRRYHAQTQTAGTAKRRKETHETGRQSGNSPGGFSRRTKSVSRETSWLRKSKQDQEIGAVTGQPAAKTKSTFREYAEAILMALLLALFIRTFIVQAFKIPSGSMIPTLAIGDHILVNKLSYGVRMPFLEDYLRRVSAARSAAT